MVIKFTRRQRLDNECTHREYYAQFVTEQDRMLVLEIEDRIYHSTCPSLNDIPLKIWTNMGVGIRARLTLQMKEVGDYVSSAGVVCTLKEAAKQLREG